MIAIRLFISTCSDKSNGDEHVSFMNFLSVFPTIRTWQAIHAKLLSGQSDAHVTITTLGNDAHLKVI